MNGHAGEVLGWGLDPVTDLIRAGREAWFKGLVNGHSGNVSLSYMGRMYISCSGVCKGRLQVGDVLRVDMDSHEVLDPGSVSSESKMHLAVYAARTQARAVVHVHPVFLLALAQTGADILKMDLFEAAQIGKEYVRVPPLPPGSQDLAQAVADASTRGRAVHMAKHGLTCWGENLEQALSLAEEVEALAKIQFFAGLGSRRGQ
ncbi:MAG: class II aldolase/adducin family protein [Desulfovermiculus sp.]|nr:class II aldolase/adducin family protein [Desulfovermiculus sp.]